MTTPDINELLDKERFSAWLRSRNPAANVGETNRSTSCPLAEYLKANGAKMPSVGPTWVVANRYVGPWIETPAWARDFVIQTDKLSGNSPFVIKVRAYQARRILEKIS